MPAGTSRVALGSLLRPRSTVGDVIVSRAGRVWGDGGRIGAEGDGAADTESVGESPRSRYVKARQLWSGSAPWRISTSRSLASRPVAISIVGQSTPGVDPVDDVHGRTPGTVVEQPFGVELDEWVRRR